VGFEELQLIVGSGALLSRHISPGLL
jgi:hypothetical protein